MTQEELEDAVRTAQKTNYLSPDYKYLKNVSIVEWDIKSAGFSVLKFKKALPEKRLEQLAKMPKEKRTVKEGLLQKQFPKLAELIVNTLAEIRTNFVVLNDIRDSEILTIKKDAIFLINHTPDQTLIKEYFNFRKKGVYSSFILLNKKEFYYSGRTDELVIKGISSENQEKQKDYLLKDIKRFLKIAEYSSYNDLYTILKRFRSQYLNRELPVEYYRELDSGLYRIGKYTADNVGEDMKESIDISQNYINYILPFISTVL